MSTLHQTKGRSPVQQILVQLKVYLLLSFIVLASLLPNLGMAAIPVSTNLVVNKETVVYITRTGEKYHQSGCRYLSKSKIEVSKKEAVKNGYAACKVCKP
ncbi:hypothetical protein [Olivibacter domesticus]|uniref:Metal binding domain of Ada n=1 Tax=Olivibacter domesticus TaxID=407022 RepID=A0A1H7GMS6_OLID1|nr:hypothetical protein [Olivibacter domesticus]SEK39379.1 hypothetical protein SAMN05661044_00135 [Olivibacter domesticus]